MYNLLVPNRSLTDDMYMFVVHIYSHMMLVVVVVMVVMMTDKFVDEILRQIFRSDNTIEGSKRVGSFICMQLTFNQCFSFCFYRHIIRLQSVSISSTLYANIHSVLILACLPSIRTHLSHNWPQYIHMDIHKYMFRDPSYIGHHSYKYIQYWKLHKKNQHF